MHNFTKNWKCQKLVKKKKLTEFTSTTAVVAMFSNPGSLVCLWGCRVALLYCPELLNMVTREGKTLRQSIIW